MASVLLVRITSIRRGPIVDLELNPPNIDMLVDNDPEPGPNLPDIRFVNESGIALVVSFAPPPPCTDPQPMAIPISGSHNMTWNANVDVGLYDYAVSASPGGGTVRPVNGDINIQT